MTPSPELKEWVALAKDVLLSLAAIVTMVLGVYGVRSWRRELKGRETYSLVRKLVKESHKLSGACRQLRMPIDESERRVFSQDEENHTTIGERWRISESEAYIERIRLFKSKVDKYQSALLDVRTALGSIAYGNYLEFGRAVTANINAVNDYLSFLADTDLHLHPESSLVLEAQRKLHPSRSLDDDLTNRTDDARETGEKSLLAYLGRKSIRG